MNRSGGRGWSRPSGPAALAAAVLLGVLVAVVGLRLVGTHRDYGVWGWSAGATPPQLIYAGHSYRRGATFTGELPAQFDRLGDGPDGGALFGPRAENSPTALLLREAGGRMTSYAVVTSG